MKLILGKSRELKTKYILDKIRKELANIACSFDAKIRKKIFLIIPDQLTYTYEQKMTDMFEGILDLEILSFSRLADNLLYESKYRNKIFLDDIGRIILIKETLEELEKENKINILYSSYKNIESISNQINEFKKYGITVEMLENYIESVYNKENIGSKENFSEEEDIHISNIFEMKLEELIQIYKGYNEKLEGKYLDIADKDKYALESLRQNNIFDNSIVYITEFLNFTENDYKYIKEINSKTDEIYVSIYTDELKKKSDYEPFVTSKKVAKKILEIAGEAKIINTDDYR